MTASKLLRIPALRIQQGPKRVLYSFAVDGKELHRFTTVSRIARGENREVEGYQRPEALAHIKNIKDYIESSDPMLPNALVVAFDSSVSFEANPSAESCLSFVQQGELIVPLDATLADEEKPGWIVDGQQRTAAIREALVSHFPICITAFITDHVEEQRSQFILVNSTKPLPKGLIYELLPTMDGQLPPLLARRRFPAKLLERLNFDEDSPLKGLIRTPTAVEGTIKDNSILKMIEYSLLDGALYNYRDPETGGGDIEEMLLILKSFWEAVLEVFPNAVHDPKNHKLLKPRQSRLVHGVGIVSLGLLMDTMTDHHLDASGSIPTHEIFQQELEAISACCAWTAGYWHFGPNHQRKWNEVQNTSADITLVSEFLVNHYMARVVKDPRYIRSVMASEPPQGVLGLVAQA